jgi:hypothetical protein
MAAFLDKVEVSQHLRTRKAGRATIETTTTDWAAATNGSSKLGRPRQGDTLVLPGVRVQGAVMEVRVQGH